MLTLRMASSCPTTRTRRTFSRSSARRQSTSKAIFSRQKTGQMCLKKTSRRRHRRKRGRQTSKRPRLHVTHETGRCEEMIFRDRKEAGQKLAERLTEYANRDDVLVLALPRGGVPLAF